MRQYTINTSIAKTIIALTTLMLCTKIWALDLYSEPRTPSLIGEEEVDTPILGSTSKHFMSGCDNAGFHIASENLGNGVQEFTIYCGPKPPGKTKYTVIKETGI